MTYFYEPECDTTPLAAIPSYCDAPTGRYRRHSATCRAEVHWYDTPLGAIGISENGSAVTGLYFGRDQLPAEAPGGESDLLRRAALQLREYLAGKRRIFELPLAPAGTPFQQSVWNSLLSIPYGETRSYGEIARSVGNPRACRAVGMANNRNPIPIFIPCHRVIGSDGSLTGYGGGLEIKERLLRLEGIRAGGGCVRKREKFE